MAAVPGTKSMSDLFLRLDWASARGRDQQSLIEDEFRAERASSLGMAGRRLERALAALEDCDDAGRENLIEPAARAAWEFMVTREMTGLRDWPSVARQYRIPRSVLLRMGAAPSKCGPDPRR
jgi:hypothetical protein